MVELTLSRTIVQRMRSGDHGMLEGADLTDRERTRLLGVVREAGIGIHCTLSRGNRLEGVAALMPMTFTLLEPVLRGLMDEHWEETRPSNYQLAGLEVAFAGFLRRKIDKGELQIEYLPEILEYETLCFQLMDLQRAGTDDVVEGLMEFEHCPDDLLPPLSRLTMPPAGLPRSSYPSRVILHSGKFSVEARR